jgi:hypothetical protein
MENLEGLWTVSFQSNFQTVGTGVVVFNHDRLLGGDSYYYYDGIISMQGENRADVTVKVVRFNKEGMAIFGNLDSFNLKVSGEIAVPKMALHGHMVEQPNMKITIKGEKITSF